MVDDAATQAQEPTGLGPGWGELLPSLDDLGRMDDADLKDFGQRVAKARVNAGWSKEEAARRAGISSITWKRVEDGLVVRDEKRGAVVQLLPDMELPPAERIEVERARLEARHTRSLERIAEMRERRASESPEAQAETAEFHRRMRELDEERRPPIWPEGVTQTTDAVLTAWYVLRGQRSIAADRVRAMYRLYADAKEEKELIEAQTAALGQWMRDQDIDPRDALDALGIPLRPYRP